MQAEWHNGVYDPNSLKPAPYWEASPGVESDEPSQGKSGYSQANYIMTVAALQVEPV